MMFLQIIPLLLIAVFTFSSIFNAVKVIVQVKKGNLDELEKKIILDSLVYTMITILILHLIQLVLGIVANLSPYKFHYRPIISSGIPFNSVISNSPVHFEAIIFDCLVFSFIYFLKKRKYRD